MPDRNVNTSGRIRDSLNPSQRAAVTFGGPGPLLVLAGPGSGKTFVITRRIQFLLTEKMVSPEKILVITFTREAALSMRERFLKESGDIPQQILQTVNFGTFHSIFYQILRQSKGITERQILGEADKKKLLLSALSVVVPEKSDQEKTYYIGDLLAAISFFKNTGDHKKTEQKLPTAFQGTFGRIYEQYEKERAAEGKMDFDDMLLDCKELLSENKVIREYWQERFTHILIDEFQDINPVQYEVIRILSAEPYSIFAVGDDDQAIYGFRGSSPECMQKFFEDYRAEKILLEINYRSCGEIVKASLAVIGENKCRFFKELKAAREEKQGTTPEGCKKDMAETGNVRVYGFTDRKEETTYLLKACEEAEDCAVLFRTNRLLQRFAVRLQRAKIPYETREKIRNPYLLETALDVMAYLRLGAGERAPELIHRIINKPSRYVNREALRRLRDFCGKPTAAREGAWDNVGKPTAAREGAWDGVGKPTAACEGVWDSVGEPTAARKGAWDSVGEPTAARKGAWERNGDSAGDPLQYLEAYYREVSPRTAEHIRLLRRHIAGLKTMPPYLGLQYIRRVIGYDNWIREKYAGAPRERDERLEILDWLGEEAREYPNLQEWLDDQGKYSDQTVQKNKHTESCKIKLMTVHASKGLEFEHVIIPDCNERIFPYGQMLEEEEIEEERRVFYVGMTRAKKQLELLYLAGSRDYPMQKSRFLFPILSGLKKL